VETTDADLCRGTGRRCNHLVGPGGAHHHLHAMSGHRRLIVDAESDTLHLGDPGLTGARLDRCAERPEGRRRSSSRRPSCLLVWSLVHASPDSGDVVRDRLVFQRARRVRDGRRHAAAADAGGHRVVRRIDDTGLVDQDHFPRVRP
jgi:hypothetical protein